MSRRVQTLNFLCVDTRRRRLLDKSEGEPEKVHIVYFQWKDNYLCTEQLAKAVLKIHDLLENTMQNSVSH